eukprot:g308.t1
MVWRTISNRRTVQTFYQRVNQYSTQQDVSSNETKRPLSPEELSEMVTGGHLDKAWGSLRKLANDGEVSADHFLSLMKTACRSSDDHRKIIQRARNLGVQPDSRMYKVLVKQLLVEGCVSSAQNVVHKEMPATGIQVTERFHRLLELPEVALTKLRTKELRRLLTHATTAKNFERFRTTSLARSESMDAAWNLLNRLIDLNVACPSHILLMLKMATLSSEESIMIIERLLPDCNNESKVAAYKHLTELLLLEGDRDTASDISNSICLRDGQMINHEIQRLFRYDENFWSKRRTKVLKSLVQQNTEKTLSTARKLLQKLVAKNVSTAAHFNAVMKSCDSADSIYDIIKDSMPRTGVSADIESYNLYIHALVLEGRVDEAKDVFEVEVPHLGLKYNEKSVWPLKTKPYYLERQRLSRLNILFERERGSAMSASWDMVNHLIENRAITIKIFRLITEYCNSSDAIDAVISTKMASVGMKPDTQIIKTLARMLMLEGNVEGAKVVIKNELPQCKDFDNKSYIAGNMILQTENYKLEHKRQAKLNYFLKSQNVLWGQEQAWKFFDKLVENKVANTHHFNNMMSCCEESVFRRDMIDNAMKDVCVKPDEVSYFNLIDALLIEGNIEAAQNVFKVEMPEAGIVPRLSWLKGWFGNYEKEFESLKALSTIHFSKQVRKEGSALLSNRRTAKLKKLLRNLAIEDAWKLFKQMERNKVVDINHFNLMIEACWTSADQENIINERMPKLGIEPNSSTFVAQARLLELEGDVDAADRMMRLVSNNSLTESLIKKPDTVLSTNRTFFLRKMLQSKTQKGTKSAKQLFDKLLERKLANVSQLNLVIHACHDWNDLTSLIERAMVHAAIPGDAVTYEAIAEKLYHFGDIEGAKRVIDVHLPNAGIQPTLRTIRFFGLGKK